MAFVKFASLGFFAPLHAVRMSKPARETREKQRMNLFSKRFELWLWQLPLSKSISIRTQRRGLKPGKVHEILDQFLAVVASREYSALHGEQPVRERSHDNIVTI